MKLNQYLLLATSCSCLLLTMVGLARAADPAGQAAATLPGIYDVRRFGAVGDGVTLGTEAIQRAIDAVSRAGGGRLVFPSPGTYLTGSIVLKDNVILEIPVGATLLGSRQYGDYREDTGVCAYPEGVDRCLIYAKGARNIGLTGRGTISGNGKPAALLQKDNQIDKHNQRPMLVRFEDCTGIHVDQLTLVEAFSWCFHFARCKDLRVQGLSIFNRRQDGIDLESCQDATVSDCNIKAGDDAIVLLANKNMATRNVTITNCILQSRWAGVRFGPLSYGDIDNVAISNCVVHDCGGGGIKIAMLEGGTIKNGTFSNITMDRVVCPILIMLIDWQEIDSGSPHIMPVGKISHLIFSHIVGTAAGGPAESPDTGGTLFLQGHPRQDLEDIALSDIDLTLAGGGTRQQAARRNMTDADRMPHSGNWPENQGWGVPPAAALYARHVKGLSLDRVRFSMARPDLRSTVFLRQSSDINIAGLTTGNSAGHAAARLTLLDCRDALISGCQDHHGGESFLAVEGPQTRGISLLGNSLVGFEHEVQRQAESPESAVQSKIPVLRRSYGE